jgi:hypothetical protein
MNRYKIQPVIAYKNFCETRTKRSVEVYRGRNLDPPPGGLPTPPPPTDRDGHLTNLKCLILIKIPVTQDYKGKISPFL